MNVVRLVLGCVICFYAAQTVANDGKAEVSESTVLRGMNTNSSLTETDIKDFSLMGGNVLRFSFALQPLMDIDPPYKFDRKSFRVLDRLLDLCEKYGVRAIIDPHRFPGTKHRWTMLGTDPFWKDFKWHEKAVSLWEEIAERYSDRGDVIAGYDLLNEPAIGFVGKNGFSALENTPADINLLYKKLISAVRKYDKKHKVVVAAPRYADSRGKHDSVEGFDILLPVEDSRVVYTVHIYQPMGFTHQGFGKRPLGIEYPGIVDGTYWDKNTLEIELRPVLKFQKKHDVEIFVGEFSAPRWTGDSGLRYLSDVISLAEEYNWSWAYHAYRQAPIWDAEMSFERDDMERRKNSPKIELLRKNFLKK